MNNGLIDGSFSIMQEASDRAKIAETPLFINFSGGKDSSVLILLAQEINANIELIYMTSGLELPGCVDFVKQEASRYNLPLHIIDPVIDYYGDFSYWVRKFNYFPSFGYAYCSTRLKLRPARAYLRKLYGRKPVYRVNGVRKLESNRRQKIYKDKPPIRPDWDAHGYFLVEPIHNWSGQDVADFLEINNFAIQKQYSVFGVSGCAYCPFYEEKIFQRILSVYPNIYDTIIALEDEIGKPSVCGNKYLRQIKENFMNNRDEIIKHLDEKSLTKKK